jgi:polysaccharide biosynthesis transport protein
MSSPTPVQPGVLDRNGTLLPPGPALPQSPFSPPGGPNTSGDGSTASGADPFAILHALRRRWPLALVLGVLAAAVAAPLGYYLLPEKHTANTLLYVQAREPSILFPGQEVAYAFANYQRAQTAMVKSRMVLNAALRQLQAKDLRLVREKTDALQWLEKDVAADFKTAPEILRISLTGSKPDDLAAVVDAIREAYLQEIVDKQRNERNNRLEVLKKLYTNYETLLSDKRKTLRTLAEAVGGDPKTVAHQHQFALERMALTTKELLQLQSDVRKVMVEASVIPAKEKALTAIEVPAELVEAEVEKDPLVLQHQADVAALEAAYERAKQGFVRGEAEPLLQKYRTPLTRAREALTAQKDKVRPLITKQLREKARHDLVLNGAEVRGRLTVLQELEKALAEDLRKQEQDTQKLKKETFDLEALREDIAQVEAVAKQAGAQIESLKVELQAPSRVTVLEEGYVTNADGEKRRLMVTGGAGAGAFGLIVFLIAWLEMRARRIATVNEVRSGLGLIPLMGTLPPVPSRRPGFLGTRLGWPRTQSKAPPQQLLAAVDATRTVLLGSAGMEAVRCLMVTSAVSGEGKTSLSSHLAVSLARVGYRTLLVDGDLRRPTLHKLFGSQLGPGLSELLRGEGTAAEVAQPTPMPGLSLLTAGNPDETSFQALAREYCGEIIRTLREQYDFVIIDSAPVLLVADALQLGRHADGVVFSLLRDVSRMPSVLAAHDRLNMLGIRTLGAVVSGVSSDVYGYTPGYPNAAAT